MLGGVDGVVLAERMVILACLWVSHSMDDGRKGDDGRRNDKRRTAFQITDVAKMTKMVMGVLARVIGSDDIVRKRP